MNEKFFLMKYALWAIGVSVLIAIPVLMSLHTTEPVSVPQLKSAEGSELHIYNWDDYFAQDTIENFEREFGITVHLDTFDDAAAGYRALAEQNDTYDLVMTEGADVRKAIQHNLVAPLDAEHISNLKNIGKKFTRPAYDPEGAYAVPYLWGTTSFFINTKYVPADTHSLSLLWDEKYAGKIALLDDRTDVFALAAKYTGTPLVPQTSEDFTRVRDALLKQKPLLYGYLTYDELEAALENDEVWIGQVYNGDLALLAEERPELVYITPDEGAILWVDSFVIPKQAKNKHNAELFLNYILRGKAGADIANAQHYASPNVKATRYIDIAILQNPSLYIDIDIDKLDAYQKLESTETSTTTEEIFTAMETLWKELLRTAP